MNPNTILGGLDPELTEQVVSRRNAVARSGKLAGALAIASMPVAFGLFTARRSLRAPSPGRSSTSSTSP